jgi:uncharacterized membrane protein
MTGMSPYRCPPAGIQYKPYGERFMNRRQFVGASSALAVALSVGLPIRATLAQAAYSSIDLGLPEGYDSVTPIAVNDNGVAVVSATAGDKHAVFLAQDGTFTQLGDKDDDAHASCIDDSNNVGGWIAGASEGSNPARDVPILLTTESQAEMPGDQLDGRVFGLQQGGTAVGEAATDPKQGDRRAVIWANQEISELKGIPKDAASAATDINGRGQITGWITRDDAKVAVLLSLDKDPVELGTLGGKQSEAVAISEQGQVVGNSTTSDDQTDLSGNGIAAFSWFEGALNPLQTIDGQAWSMAADVNSYGLVAGTVGLSAPATASAATTAVVWAPDAVLDLNQSAQPIEGITLTSAVSINELGQILCAGVDASGSGHAVLLSIVGN